MSLPDRLVERLEAALLAAFPDDDALDTLLRRVGMQARVPARAALATRVTKLVESIAAQGRVLDILDAARDLAPGNAALAKVQPLLLPVAGGPDHPGDTLARDIHRDDGDAVRSRLPLAYPDAEVEALSKRAEDLRVRRDKLRAAGIAADDLDREYRDVREQLRRGGYLRVGDSLGDGRYLLVKMVARGGFGIVWDALDRTNDQRVAIKVLHTNLAGDLQRRERFFRGASAMMKLAHPGVVRVLDPMGEDGGFCYFVMEFVPGGNLREAVLAQRVRPDDVLRLILQVGEALALAHASRMIHRDIKPANVMLDEHGNAKLTDFDLVGAHDTTGGTRTGAMGTVVYAAPECLHKPQDATARADVFGLGMTALFCLSGQDLTMDTLMDRAGALAELPCTEPVRQVLERAVEWKADRRFADAAAMVDALRQALEPSHLHPPRDGNVARTERRPAGDLRDNRLSADDPAREVSGYPRRFGKYDLLRPLTQAGMGALHLAMAGDRGLERLMVIKTVLPHLADAEYVARFHDEAKVVVKLSHGNLIPVFDTGIIGGELFLAMDFVEGRDLRTVWNRCAKRQVAFPIDVAVYIVKELCRGLAYAHAFPDLHLVLRDISPPNVLVSCTGEVKLTDLGLASSTLKLEKTAPGIIYGKVAYMSPEQARGEKLDGRSDMYGAAIVLWELLTGRQLFPPGRDQIADLLARAKNPELTRPSRRAPRVPVELDEICLKALAPAREDRYADCDAMRMTLQGWLTQNAPTTDGRRIAAFFNELFAEDIQRDRAELVELRRRVRSGLALRDASAPPRVNVGRTAFDQVSDADANAVTNRGLAGASSDTNTDAEPDFIGVKIDERYRVLELIGEGGTGKVYLAEHVEIGKRVALKILHPSYSRMPDLVERFRREARAASKIGHPNIVDITDSGTTADGSVYFAMEYLQGVELGSVIEHEGALDVARALKIASQTCRALAAAHREGIIHRDLKPENIFLITRDGTADVVKVLDFGIAKTTQAEAPRERRLTSPGMAMGTPEYMSPEQAAGRPADARCDVYALGAIMYEMLTGIPSYSGDNFMEILTKKATIDPPPPLVVRSELPGQVSELVMAAMARNPSDRPQTMETLEYELNKCLAGRGVAVAQILGLTTDARTVATLNSRLAMRTFDDAVVVARAQTGSPPVGLARAGTHSGLSELPAMWSGPAMATNQNSLIARPVHEPVGSSPGRGIQASTRGLQPLRASAPQASDQSPQATRRAVAQNSGALGRLGWQVFILILSAGIGVLLYLAAR